MVFIFLQCYLNYVFLGEDDDGQEIRQKIGVFSGERQYTLQAG